MVLRSEEDVKKVLDIDTWRHLSKEKVFQLVAMMPEMEKDVQLKIIEQLPELTKLSVKAMTTLRRVHESTLSSNEKSQEHVHRAFQEARATITAQLQRDDLDPETRRHLSDLLVQTADKESAKDTENKSFLDRLVNKTTVGVAAAAILVTVVAAGGKAALQNGEALRKF